MTTNTNPTTGNKQLDMVVTLLRYALASAGMWMAAKGATDLQFYGGLLLTIGVAAYGAWRTKHWSELLAVVTVSLSEAAKHRNTLLPSDPVNPDKVLGFVELRQGDGATVVPVAATPLVEAVETLDKPKAKKPVAKKAPVSKVVKTKPKPKVKK